MRSMMEGVHYGAAGSPSTSLWLVPLPTKSWGGLR